MKDTWWQLARSEVERESTLINQRITWLLTSQSVFFAAFSILLTSGSKDKPIFDPSLIHEVAFLFPVIGIMISTSVLIGNLGAYVGMYRVSSQMKLENTGEDSRSLIFKGRTPFILGFIASTGVTLSILVSWIIVLILIY